MARALSRLLLISMFVTAVTVSQVFGECSETDDCDNSLSRGISDSEIAAHPSPEVKQLYVDTDRLNDRYYQRVINRVEIFDAPDGNVVGILDEGFNFVTVLTVQGEWTEINRGQWIRSENLTNSKSIISQFSGVLLPDDGLPYPMAWVLVNLYPSRTPGGSPAESNPLMYRYTRVYLYTSVEIDGAVWYQIGVDQWVHQHNIAKIILVERPSDVDTDRWLSIDLYEQTLIAYDGDQPVFATLIAAGLERWPTREGLYHIYYRHQREGMTGGQPGDDFYYLEDVPWTMFFDEGRALHGAYWHDGLGYRRSHGCVNMSITDAHWLYVWVAEVMGSMTSADRENGPAVYIYSSGQY
jgi:hypothetical protein